MNSDVLNGPADPSLISRREALRRTALMLGVAVTPSLISGVMQAQTAAARSNPAARFLTAAQFATASVVAERIIPKTDTPGATDVGVPGFIDLMYGKYMTAAEKRVFAAGLADVEQASVALGQRSFSQFSPTQQDAVLTKIATAAQSRENTFFHLMKELTLLGYFTSEIGCTQAQRYVEAPGKFEPCVPYTPGERTWAAHA